MLRIPKTLKSYAAKFAFWPLIFCSHSLGYPLSRAIFGMLSRYSLDFAKYFLSFNFVFFEKKI